MRLILLLFVTTGLLGSCQSDVKKDDKPSEEETYVAPNIEGHWKYVAERTLFEPPGFVSITDSGEYIAKEMQEFLWLRRTDYVFTQDSFFRFSFPMELFDKGTYRIDTQYLFLEGDQPYAPMPIQAHDDSLLIYMEEDHLYLKLMLLQDKFDDNLVSLLKKDQINYAQLSRKWRLIDGDSGGDGTGVDYLFPFDISDSLIIDDGVLTAENLKDSIVELTIGGKLRPFYFYFWYDDDSNQHMRLEPTESWDESEARMWFLPWPNDWAPEDYPTTEDIRKAKEGNGSKLFLEYVD